MINDRFPIESVDLDTYTLVRRGRQRNIYELPDYPSVVLKTIQPERVDKHGNFPERGRLKNLRGYGAYFVFLREIAEYLRLRRIAYGKNLTSLPITAIYGFMNTNEGIGLIVERISDESGQLAPTLRELVASGGLTLKHERALEAFQRTCKAMHVVFGDVHWENIVYTEARTGEPEWVCIDGFGEKSILPFHLLSKTLNAKKVDRVIERIIRQATAGGTKAGLGKSSPSFATE